MKFVALVSGGKDSCHTICKSVFQYGHELVCIANLAPPDDFDGEEMNSFMFQTAASNTIAKLAQCFGVPLVRLPIKGSAVTQSLDYTAEVSGDEVEDLFFLLSEVKSQFPEVVAVSCGAILSTYQRLRVENVCSRLNLMVISYLWQRNRHSLLQEMLDDQLEAVLVKVAGAGLDPYKHLGRSLNALWGTLQHLSQRFGLDACGEGGEYETLTLSCRFFALTGRRLQLDETEVLIDDENCEVGNLKVVSCSVVPSSETAVASVPSAAAAASAANKLIVHELVEILQLICTDSCDRLTSLAQFSSSIATVSGEHKLEDYASFCNRTAVCLRHQQEQFRTWSSSRGDDYPISIPTIKIGLDGFGHTSLVYPPPALQLQAAEAADPALAAPRQLAGIMRSLEAALHRCGVSCADILYIHLYIASNELFAAVNAEYSKHFGVYPPSRSCVTVRYHWYFLMRQRACVHCC